MVQYCQLSFGSHILNRNSFFFFLNSKGMVGFIIVRTFFQDFSRYNRVSFSFPLSLIHSFLLMKMKNLIQMIQVGRWFMLMSLDHQNIPYSFSLSYLYSLDSIMIFLGKWYSSCLNGPCYHHISFTWLYFSREPRNYHQLITCVICSI